MKSQAPQPEVERIAQQVIGAAIEVHHELGPGFSQEIYLDALNIELHRRGLETDLRLKVPVEYKGHRVGSVEVDLRVEQAVAVQVPAAEALLPVHEQDLRHRLGPADCGLGLLIQFHSPTLKNGVRRVLPPRGAGNL